MAEGDAKLTGRGMVVEAPDDLARFRGAFAAATGNDAPPGPMDPFRVDVTEVSFLSPAGDHLLMK